AASYPQRERNCDPDAETVKAIQQVRPEPVSGFAAEPHDEIPRPILCGQEVCDAPNAERTNHEPIESHRVLSAVRNLVPLGLFPLLEWATPPLQVPRSSPGQFALPKAR